MNSSHSYTTVFFDLDGTLLPIDTDQFMAAYTKSLAEFAQAHGMDGKAVMKALFEGVKAMAANDGSHTNRDAFWEIFSTAVNGSIEEAEEIFGAYYAGPFNEIARLAEPNPAAARAIATLKRKGYTVALTTMPMFPIEAVHARMKWTGLSPDDFAFVTDYATASSVKPLPLYYEGALQRAGVKADEVLMVGNNTREDGGAARVGTDMYFVTDHLIEHEEGLAIADCKHGTLEEFAAFCESLPEVE